MHRISSLTGAYQRLPDHAALAVLAAVLLTYAVTSSWVPLAIEAALLIFLFYLRWEPGLFLIVFSIPFAFAYKHVGAANISPTEVLTVTTAAGWALRWFAHFSTPVDFKRWVRVRLAGFSGMDWAVLFFLAVCLASLLVAEDVPAALWELRILVVEPLLLYLLIRANPLDRETLLHLADALVLGAVVASLIGLYYYFILNYVEAAEGVRRLLTVFYDSPNHLSLFLGRVMPVAVCMAAFATSSRTRRVLHALALIPLLLCIYLTYSRGAWLLGVPASLLFVLLLSQFRERKRSRRAIPLILGALALAALALLPVARTVRFASLFNLQSGTSFLRLVLWLGALRMIQAHPILGVGIGNFEHQYPRYMLPEAWREPKLFHAHNMLLDYWTTLGIPGVAALVWLQVAFWQIGLRLYRMLGDPDLQALMLGLMGSMVNFLAHGLVDTAYFLTDLAFIFMLTIGITRKMDLDSNKSDISLPSAPARDRDRH